MDSTNPQPEPTSRLKSLLKEADLKSFRLDARLRGILFQGRSREWLLRAGLNENWLHVYTVVCGIPEEPGLRARLFETLMTTNASLTLAKFVAGPGGLVLEVDYRAEHVDAAVLRNVVSHVHWIAEEQYPKIFRIVSGDEVLRELGTQLAPPEAA